MVRAFPILALLLLAAPAAAAADCMCVAVQPGWDQNYAPAPAWAADNLLVAPSGLERVELGPFFSSDGSALSSALPNDTRPNDTRPNDTRPATPSTPRTLWCASPNDPRCSGGEAPPGRGPQTGDASYGAAGTDGSLRLTHRPLGAVVRPAHGDGPRMGVFTRLDRPPQS